MRHQPAQLPSRAAPLVLVDDDPALLHALSFAFETEGYLVHAFSDAESLLAHAEARHRAVCFVLSQRLPGMTGLGLLAALRAEGIATPAILTTFNPPPAVGRAADAAGVDIVEKPLLDGILATKVREAVNGIRIN
ncbi:MAG: response regulator [Hyphomonadaceae bacterium]